MINKNAKPSRQWLKFVKTNKARSKIKSVLGMTIEHEKKDDIELMPIDILKRIDVVGKKAPVKLSKCCSPKLLDPIVGFLTKDKKITIHKKDCPNIHTLDSKKEITVLWKDENRLPIIKLALTMVDKVGTLAKVLNLIAEYKLNLKNINTKPKKESVVTTLSVEVDSELKLKDVINEIKKMEEIIHVVKSK